MDQRESIRSVARARRRGECRSAVFGGALNEQVREPRPSESSVPKLGEVRDLSGGPWKIILHVCREHGDDLHSRRATRSNPRWRIL
jgi:hypothetical protein